MLILLGKLYALLASVAYLHCHAADKPLKSPSLTRPSPGRPSLGLTGRIAILAIRTYLLGTLVTTITGLLSAMPALAVVSSDALMPYSTRGFLSVDDINSLSANWQQTQLGQLIQDDAMRPFVEDMKRQLQRKFNSMRKKLGLELGDLKNIAGGEIGLALAERPDERAALLLTVDITDHQDQTRQLLNQVDRELKKRGAKRSETKASGTTLTSYDIPPQRENGIAREAVFFVKDNMLCASDSRVEIEEMLQRFGDQAGNRLLDAKPYQETMRRCQKGVGQLKPELRWFLDPFGYARSLRSLDHSGKKRHGKDFLKILTEQGFDAIQGLGGYLNVSAFGSYELLHRTAVYAPPIPGVKDKYRLAMRMMEFPNSGKLALQPWVPRKLATYRTFNLNVQNAFEHIDTLFDAYVGQEEAFAAVLKGLLDDPYGPRIDMRKDFIANLGQRITLLTDYEVPITTKSERFLFMIEVTDVEAITKTVEKFMEHDPCSSQTEFEGTVIWEIIESDDEELELDISIPAFDSQAAEGDGNRGGGDPVIPSSAVSVFDGHLMIASRIDFLKSVIKQKQAHQSLASAGDYREVEVAMSHLMPDSASFRFFLRTDEAYRPTYELLRQGKMPESETLLGRLLNRMLTQEEDEYEGILREQKIDGQKLPSFEMVRRYLGPAGTLVRSDDDGWFIVGATLSKQTPQARAGAVAPAEQSAIR